MTSGLRCAISGSASGLASRGPVGPAASAARALSPWAVAGPVLLPGASRILFGADSFRTAAAPRRAAPPQRAVRYIFAPGCRPAPDRAPEDAGQGRSGQPRRFSASAPARTAPGGQLRSRRSGRTCRPESTRRTTHIGLRGGLKRRTPRTGPRPPSPGAATDRIVRRPLAPRFTLYRKNDLAVPRLRRTVVPPDAASPCGQTQ